MVETSPSLIKPRKNHFHAFPFGVSMVIGNNGFIFIYPTETEENPDAVIGKDIRENITRVRNCVLILSKYCLMIYDTSILYCFDYSQGFSGKELLESEVQKECALEVKRQLTQLE